LNDYTLHSSLLPFESYNTGDELFASLDREHDLLDRDLRLWAEECDSMQGVQVFTGADDAWAGFASRYVERVRDEFGKVGIWVWGVEEGGGSGSGQGEKQLLRTINAARTLHDISAHASMYIPLAMTPRHLPSYVCLDRSSHWHTSALLATAIESVTLPSRMRNDDQKRRTFNDLEAALNVNGNQRIARLQCSILDPEELARQRRTRLRAAQKDQRAPGAERSNVPVAEDELQAGDAGAEDLDIDFFPGEPQSMSSYGRKTAKAAHIFGQIDSYRGNFEEPDRDHEEDEGYARKRRRIAGLPMVERFHTPLPHPLLPTFPRIFPSFISPDSLAIHASLSSTTQVAVRVKALQKTVMRMVGFEEREALGNELGEIAEAYEEGWDSGSDSDEDD
ncbi:MAG: hypothetical protein Q9187_006140, partial [Circinaria calcarea]